MNSESGVPKKRAMGKQGQGSLIHKSCECQMLSAVDAGHSQAEVAQTFAVLAVTVTRYLVSVFVAFTGTMALISTSHETGFR